MSYLEMALKASKARQTAKEELETDRQTPAPAASTPAPIDLAPCGSPDCGGCYDIGDGRKIHPPKPTEAWLAWLERWEPKGKPQ